LEWDQRSRVIHQV